jgi:hypothetical protein
MSESKIIDPSKLRRMAIIPIVAGIVALIVGAVAVVQFNERVAEQHREFRAGQRKMEDIENVPILGIVFIGAGALAIAFGLAMIAHANRGKALRAQLQRYLDDPVLREVMSKATTELARGNERTCPCGASNASDARFCSQCGRAL